MTQEAPGGSLARVIVPTREVTLRPRREGAEAETLTIRPFKFGQLSKVLKHVGVLLAYADELGDIDIIAAMEGATEEVFELLGLLLKKPREFFEDLELDEGADLAVAMVEVNEDFFVHHVLPKIQQYLPQADGDEDTAEATTAGESTQNSEDLEAPASPSSDQTDELLGIPAEVIPPEMRITGQNS